MGPSTAISNTLRNAFRFSGRATRAEFWWSWLALWLVAQIIVLYRGLPLTGATTDAALTFVLCVIAVPMVSVGTRRLADAGVWRWFFLLTVVLGIAVQFSWLLPLPSASQFWMMTFQAERNDVVLPLTGYELRKFLYLLRDVILPWSGQILAILCLVLALLPSRKGASNSGPHISEVIQ